MKFYVLTYQGFINDDIKMTHARGYRYKSQAEEMKRHIELMHKQFMPQVDVFFKIANETTLAQLIHQYPECQIVQNK